MSSQVTIKALELKNESYKYISIADVPNADSLPFSLRVMLENLLRQAHQAVAPLAPTRVRVKPASWASARG